MSGSVWNSNSWHWEERNYNKWGESYIKSKLLNFRVEDNDIIIYTDDVEIKGNASVSIRKGKQIVTFEYEIKFDWLTKERTNKKECRGSVEILDFSNCSVEDNDYEIRIENDSQNDESNKVSTFLKKKGTEKIRELLKEFPSDLLKHDSNESKKEHQLKEEEEKKMNNLKNEKLNEKERIEKVETVPKKLSEKEKGTDKSLSEGLSEGLVKSSVEGSVWNVNNYHWEEKCLTSWAKTELKNLLDNTPIQLSNNILFRLFDSVIEGDASVNIRKQKKIFIYDLKINSEWISQKKKKNKEIEIEGKGHISISEIVSDISNDEENEYKYNFAFDHDSIEMELMNDTIRKEVPLEIKKLIETFILKMKEK